ncbi:MAG TPA: trigger factor [Thermoanaerobacterales bacterium]|nr:trigger factor [Thermoanaerobacterales bacterium]
MKVNLEKIEKNTAYLNFEVDEVDFDKAIEQAYKKNAKRFNVPGFRRGKAPRRLVELHYGPEVFYEDAVQILLPEAYKKGVEEFKLQPVDQPKFDIQQIEIGQPLKATAEVTVKPEVNLKEYKGLEVEKFVYNVTDGEVEKELAKIQERNSRLVVVEDRPAKEYDIAVIDFKGTVDDKPFDGGTAENYPLELGSGMFIKGFEEQVIGMAVGETKDINVKFPDDYNVKELASKDAVFNVHLKELKKKELLPIDDEFAKDVSEFETLDELKRDIKEKLQQKAKSVEEGSLKASIVNKLMENAEIDVPDVMIDHEIERLMMDFAINLRFSGYDLKTYLESTGVTPEEFRERFRDQAKDNVKSSLVLEEIGNRENITVTDEELNNKIKELADTYKKSVEDYEKNLKAEDKERIKDSIWTEKIFDFLIQNAVIKEKKEDNKEDNKAEDNADNNMDTDK